jgi:hypothetical protein
VLSKTEVVAMAEDITTSSDSETIRLEGIAKSLRPGPGSMSIPADAKQEMREFAAKSQTNYLPLIVDVFAQSLQVVGYRGSESADNLAVWDELWQPNGMDARQAGIIRSSLEYGYGFGVVLPGDPVPVMRGRSARQMRCQWASLDDVWPRFALDLVDPNNRRLLTDEYVYNLVKATGQRGGSDKWVVESVWGHGLGVCPVVRFRNEIVLDNDMPQGVVEPLIPVQSRIDETVFGLLTAQYFSAFHQRWVTGWTVPTDPVTGAPASMKTSVAKLMAFEDPDVKVGQFAASDLKGYLDSKQSGVQDLAAIAQVPPQALLGHISNLSAEALAATNDGRDRRAGEFKVSLGESFEQFLRLGAAAAGDVAGAEDESAQVRWADTTARSIAQTVDALGKMSSLLGIPAQGLWDRIPDTTDQDIEQWKLLKEQEDSLGLLAGVFDDQATPPPVDDEFAI